MSPRISLALGEDGQRILFQTSGLPLHLRRLLIDTGEKHPSNPACNFLLSVDDALATLPSIPSPCLSWNDAAKERLLGRKAQKHLELQESKKQIDLLCHRMGLLGQALFPFQRIGALYLAERDRALLCDQMGLGKTIQALAALPTNAPAIVVCPAVVKGVWLEEIKRWRPDLTASAPDHLTRWPRSGEVVVINPERLGLPPSRPTRGTVLIGDEAHIFKNKKSRRHQAFLELRKAVMGSDGRTWLLTATPLLNRPLELCALLEAGDLMSGSFGNFGRFYGLFQARKGKYGTEWGKPTPEVADTLRRVMIRRLRHEVMPELPTKIYKRIFVPKDPVTDRLCERIVEVCGGLAGLEKMLTDSAMQVEFGEISSLRKKLATAKIPALSSVVQSYADEEEPLVMFSDHVAPAEAMAKDFGFGRVTGAESADMRTETVKQFQAGQLPGIAATIAAGGVGITLTRAAHVVFVDRSWVPAMNAQAEDRVCRIGQSRGVVITTVLCDHALDLRVEEVVSEKNRLIHQAIDGASEP